VEPIPAEIPMPGVLDPDRVRPNDDAELSDAERRDRAQRLERALQDSCAYGQLMWRQLQSVRAYLLSSLPPDPHGQPLAVRRGAAPESPGDEAGWAAWMSAYTEVTSRLAGPRGDSGFAASEAQRVAQERRG
jgi:hypothetical protein